MPEGFVGASGIGSDKVDAIHLCNGTMENFLLMDSQTIIDKNESYLKVVKAELGAYMHPSKSGDVIKGVKELLNSLLLRNNQTFGGVILAYMNTKIVKGNHKILQFSGYFHVRLTSNLLLFSPKPGDLIEGKVNKVEKEYIGVLIFGLFNAAINVNDIREDLYFDDRAERLWISEREPRHKIKLGSGILFLVKSMQDLGDFIDIRGSLQPENTGSIRWLRKEKESVDTSVDNQERSSHRKKKRKREEGTVLIDDKQNEKMKRQMDQVNDLADWKEDRKRKRDGAADIMGCNEKDEKKRKRRMSDGADTADGNGNDSRKKIRQMHACETLENQNEEKRKRKIDNASPDVSEKKNEHKKKKRKSESS